MAGKQHVDAHRKLLLRRELLTQAVPGAAYIPFCGDGDLAAELYANRPMYGCDLDEARIATIRNRLPSGQWAAHPAEDFFEKGPFDLYDLLPGSTATFAVADFDAYSYPYDAFRDFWKHSLKAERVVMFFTDGILQTIRRRVPAGFRRPDGEHVDQLPKAESSRTYNMYWSEQIEPWIGPAVAPWTVTKTSFYPRGGNVLYWGCVVERPANDSGRGPNVADGDPLRTREDGDIPSPESATDAELGYDPQRHYRFDALKRRQFLKLIADGSTRSAAAKAVGVNLRTVERAIVEGRGSSKFEEMLSWAEMEVDDEIEGSLFQAARSGNVPAMQMWLYNRRPERWADRRRHDVNMVVDSEAIKVIADIISRTVTDPDTLARLRSELARLSATPGNPGAQRP